jgi:hypothetical protein
MDDGLFFVDMWLASFGQRAASRQIPEVSVRLTPTAILFPCLNFSGGFVRRETR